MQQRNKLCGEKELQELIIWIQENCLDPQCVELQLIEAFDPLIKQSVMECRDVSRGSFSFGGLHIVIAKDKSESVEAFLNAIPVLLACLQGNLTMAAIITAISASCKVFISILDKSVNIQDKTDWKILLLLSAKNTGMKGLTIQEIADALELEEVVVEEHLSNLKMQRGILGTSIPLVSSDIRNDIVYYHSQA
ncbi:MAG: hypothetical protein NC489_33405 [Ruminococcus flavefaciens]|nr:hypothetical protein [Ruminococcus flavefaciens]